MNKRETLVNYDICIANTEHRIAELHSKIEELEYYLNVLKNLRAEAEGLAEELPL